MRGGKVEEMPVGEVQNLVNKLEVEVGRDRFKINDRKTFLKIPYFLRASQNFLSSFSTVT